MYKLLCTVHCTLYTVHCTQNRKNWTPCIVHFPVYIVKVTFYTHWSYYLIHCKRLTLHCVLYSVHYIVNYKSTMYIVQWWVYSIHCKMTTVHSALYIYVIVHCKVHLLQCTGSWVLTLFVSLQVSVSSFPQGRWRRATVLSHYRIEESVSLM